MTSRRLSIISLIVASVAAFVTVVQTLIAYAARDDFLRANLNSRMVDLCASFSSDATALLYRSTAEAHPMGDTEKLANLHGKAVAINILARSSSEDGRDGIDTDYLSEYAEVGVFADLSTAASVEDAVKNLAARVLGDCALSFEALEAR